jgi:MFS family permease
MTWLPSYLSQQHGFSLTQSSLWTAVTVVGMGLGILVFGHLADSFGRRPVFFVYQAGAALSVLIYSQLSGSIALLIGGAVMGLFVNGMVGGYGAVMSEVYPTVVRATAQNVLYNLGRAVGGLGPLVIGMISARSSFAAAVGLLSVIYVVDIFATFYLVPEKRGYALE